MANGVLPHDLGLLRLFSGQLDSSYSLYNYHAAVATWKKAPKICSVAPDNIYRELGAT